MSRWAVPGKSGKRLTGGRPRWTVREAVKRAIKYTQLGIEMATKMGSGSGPLNHGCLTTARVLAL